MDDYLPPEFHTKAGFESARTLLWQQPINKRSQLALVLGIGLVARELVRQEEIEMDDPPPGVPPHVINSELNLPWVESLLADSNVNLSSAQPSRKRKAKGAEAR
jgi:hypothetical protein